MSTKEYMLRYEWMEFTLVVLEYIKSGSDVEVTDVIREVKKLLLFVNPEAVLRVPTVEERVSTPLEPIEEEEEEEPVVPVGRVKSEVARLEATTTEDATVQATRKLWAPYDILRGSIEKYIIAKRKVMVLRGLSFDSNLVGLEGNLDTAKMAFAEGGISSEDVKGYIKSATEMYSDLVAKSGIPPGRYPISQDMIAQLTGDDTPERYLSEMESKIPKRFEEALNAFRNLVEKRPAIEIGDLESVIRVWKEFNDAMGEIRFFSTVKEMDTLQDLKTQRAQAFRDYVSEHPIGKEKNDATENLVSLVCKGVDIYDAVREVRDGLGHDGVVAIILNTFLQKAECGDNCDDGFDAIERRITSGPDYLKERLDRARKKCQEKE